MLCRGAIRSAFILGHLKIPAQSQGATGVCARQAHGLTGVRLSSALRQTALARCSNADSVRKRAMRAQTHARPLRVRNLCRA